MSKQKTNKKSNQLSPENYIRQRARNLPIYKCWINKEWRNTKAATIFVARQHSSGNLTFCLYMVDLMCMGIKNTMYRYNVPEEELQRIHKEAGKENWVFDEIPYRLAHNIIYAGVDYAAEYGFSPVPDFTRVTQYLLEEDTEAIPLINIQCGDENGNPIYINAGLESPAKEQQIIKRLNETAGEGNYTFLHLDDDQRIDNAYERMKSSFRVYNETELKARFVDTMKMLEAAPLGEEKQKHISSLCAMMDVMLEDLIDENTLNKYLADFKKIFDVTIIDTLDIPNSYFSGLHPDNVERTVEIYPSIIESLQAGNIEPAMRQFREEIGDIPAAYYLELIHSNLPDGTDREKLKENFTKYPDYLMFKILSYAADLSLHKQFKTLLKESEPVTDVEFSEFLNSYALHCLPDKRISVEELVAFEDVVYRFKALDIEVSNAMFMIFVIKTEIVKSIYGIEEDLIK
jgi:hypothetical protein